MRDFIKLEEFGTKAQSIAPIGIVMSFFTLIYAIWFGFAWGLAGWLIFIMLAIFCMFIVKMSIDNIQHSKKFHAVSTDDSRAIEKKMKILSIISYSSLWLAVIISALLGKVKFIMPIVTLIIGIHFLPQASIMSRKIDYFIAPIPITFAFISIWLAFTSDLNWQTLYAISGIGGSIATISYAVYMIVSYKKLVQKYQVDY